MKRLAFKNRWPGLLTLSASVMLGSISAARAAETSNGFNYADLAPKKGLKAFEYMESPAPMPNYIAGAKWGTVGEAIKTMQQPLSPEESQTHIVLQPGFEARLFAAEPEIVKPICMAWDERGQLWIAETFDYPNERQEPGKGRDRIKICEDTDGDGRADKFTIFAENLSIPTSMVFANGGVIVSQPPDMLFLKDTDGDGRADDSPECFSPVGAQPTPTLWRATCIGDPITGFGVWLDTQVSMAWSEARRTSFKWDSFVSSPMVRNWNSFVPATITPGVSASVKKVLCLVQPRITTPVCTCQFRTVFTKR